MRFFAALFEDYTVHETKLRTSPKLSRWVHYTDHEMLTIKPERSHLDPVGIYFFPEDYTPKAVIWHDKKYRFIVTLKPDVRVLDLARISDEKLDELMGRGEVEEQFQRQLEEYPPKDHVKKVDMAWERITGSFKPQKWNIILRQMGYDAVFDDAGIIHTVETVQLLVLNPRAINVVSRERVKPKLFEKMQLVVDQLVAVCKPYGDVEVDGPRMMRDYSSLSNKNLMARVNVRKSEHNYALFKVNVEIQRDSLERYQLHAHLWYSEPRLDYGVGATYEVGANRWQFDGLKSIEYALSKIFESKENGSM